LLLAASLAVGVPAAGSAGEAAPRPEHSGTQVEGSCEVFLPRSFFLKLGPARASGELFAADFNRVIRPIREFQNALLTEVGVPVPKFVIKVPDRTLGLDVLPQIVRLEAGPVTARFVFCGEGKVAGEEPPPK
jgi:hypothetical protein